MDEFPVTTEYMPSNRVLFYNLQMQQRNKESEREPQARCAPKHRRASASVRPLARQWRQSARARRIFRSVNAGASLSNGYFPTSCRDSTQAILDCV